MKHLLSTRDLDRETAVSILDIAEDMARAAAIVRTTRSYRS